ncbi:MAG: hypothetical protein AVDCRST_MAG73-2868 [uncultured Thermomicrobiales bacterium]|uniref:Uncharacterized protein n=1 Tax=uncultured Thermomicrobiales bacterium TaxID=1645740 RepID=A0A6J4UMY5_9BACT|nr:MAG: hypothetical protein AVDCRST_MAG73-2868 [uncultured Thermomicrobiales bacterium]
MIEGDARATQRTGTALSDSGFSATLLNLAPYLLTLATVVTVVLYIVPASVLRSDERASWWSDWANYTAPLAGLLVAAVVGVVAAWLNRDQAAPDRVQPRSYGELCERWSALDARVEKICPSANLEGLGGDAATPPVGSVATAPGSAAAPETEAMDTTAAPATDPTTPGPDPGLALGREIACAEARVHRDYIATELGLVPGSNERGPRTTGTRWVLGTGFVDAWTRLHAAEAALFLVAPVELVIGAALHDEMRLKGSPIQNADDQLHKLRWAVHVLGGTGYLTPASQPPAIGAEDRTPAALTQARVALRGVRLAIEEFRDARRDALVRARNNLTWTGMVTGILAYALLGTAILVEAPSEAVVTALVFYLVGAVVGLFGQLGINAHSTGETEDDFGLSQARLLYSPMLSGLAAVGGVVTTTMLYATLNGPILTAPADIPVVATATTGATATTPSPTGLAGFVTPIATGATLPAATASAGAGTASPAGRASPTASATARATATATVTPTATGNLPRTATGTATAVPASGATAPGPTGTPDETTPALEIPALRDIFDLNQDRFGLVLAAIFGLTPGLLIDRLQGQANRYKSDLQRTNAQ